jgi:hypothetical protein
VQNGPCGGSGGEEHSQTCHDGDGDFAFPGHTKLLDGLTLIEDEVQQQYAPNAYALAI